ncbi:hypothetical protein SPRG_20493 [Saprolegnia parasitica CBS 223.65]|uniref:F-box domain-containing protein n=1 Tax=Saprolegnia parasitica (strain CBS 223.65) TaxID=695850 RepID=A0A067C899_SAPPC|nr:hypothetical protein SPRG_20493 [Saprolegnia parasitica CBS 223.65]KDO26693.1 hypothetical protein SPRG_20493 [Saprolegnia parasitica CBS 223.65]|eukprot:XP_012202583.1 hypothetical protein SPRG_20493 [Saprolegnia parasitica CBS 223.65]
MLLDLGPDVLEVVAEYVDVRSLLQLAATARLLHTAVAASPVLWEALCVRDFRIAPQAFPRATAHWATLYRRMHAPIVLTWGVGSNGRLGPGAGRATVDRPRAIDTSALGKVARITCSGFGMHALTQDGRIWFWGSLNGYGSHGPLPVPLHEPCRSLSSGRTHGCARGESGAAYAWTELGSPVQCNSAKDAPVVDVVAGWSHVAVLFANGAVKTSHLDDLDAMASKAMVQLPLDDARAVQVVAGEDFTAVVTDAGHVYLWRQNPMDLARLNDDDGRPVVATHATACFRTLSIFNGRTNSVQCFAVTSTDLNDVTPATLASLGVCKVTHGDWHSGVLTSTGHVWTWGNGSAALGTGDHGNREVPTPTQVTTGLENLFVFDIGFGGWHSAALAVAL